MSVTLLIFKSFYRRIVYIVVVEFSVCQSLSLFSRICVIGFWFSGRRSPVRYKNSHGDLVMLILVSHEDNVAAGKLTCGERYYT